MNGPAILRLQLACDSPKGKRIGEQAAPRILHHTRYPGEVGRFQSHLHIFIGKPDQTRARLYELRQAQGMLRRAI
jgi:hypothetical protein